MIEMTQLTVSERRLVQLIRIGLKTSSNLSHLDPIDDAEWVRTVAIAEQHDIAAWLYFALKEEGWLSRLPPQIAESLRSAFLRRSVNFELRCRLLDRIMPRLAEAGIVPVLFKGVVLAFTVYPDPICRGMGDLDFLVTADELPLANAILKELGYTSRDKSTRPLELQRRYGGEVQLFGATMMDGMIELHWSAFPGEWMLRTANVDEAGIRARTQVTQLGKHSALALSPEDTVIQLAAHFAISHQLSVPWLRALLDLALVFQTLAVDWNKVIERAREWRLANVLYVVLKLTHDLMGQPHEEIVKRLSPSLPRRIALAKIANLTDIVQMRNLTKGPLRFVYLMLLVDRFRDAVRLLGEALWPGQAWLSARYGRSGLSIQLRHLANAVQGRV